MDTRKKKQQKKNKQKNSYTLPPYFSALLAMLLRTLEVKEKDGSKFNFNGHHACSCAVYSMYIMFTQQT